LKRAGHSGPYLQILALILISSFLVHVYAISDGAEIKSIDYSIKNKVLILSARIDYNFTTQNNLKVMVDSYSPPKIVSQVLTISPGIGTKYVDLQMESIPLDIYWHATVSLRLVNEKGENLDLLYVRNIEIDLKDLVENQRRASEPWPALVLTFSTFLLGLVIYLKGRGKRQRKAKTVKRR